MSHSKKIFQIVGCILLLLLPALAIAQPGFDEDVSDVPIDGGLSLLVAAGIGYGAKKMKTKKSFTNKY